MSPTDPDDGFVRVRGTAGSTPAPEPAAEPTPTPLPTWARAEIALLVAIAGNLLPLCPVLISLLGAWLGGRCLRSGVAEGRGFAWAAVVIGLLGAVAQVVLLVLWAAGVF